MAARFFLFRFCLFLLRAFGAFVLFLMVALVVRVALRLSGVLLRVALKHRGSVAAGLGCGLWPADSVDCGDCGLAGSAVGGQGGGGSPLTLLPRRPLPHGAEKLPAQLQLPLAAARRGSPI